MELLIKILENPVVKYIVPKLVGWWVTTDSAFRYLRGILERRRMGMPFDQAVARSSMTEKKRISDLVSRLKNKSILYKRHRLE